MKKYLVHSFIVLVVFFASCNQAGNNAPNSDSDIGDKVKVFRNVVQALKNLNVSFEKKSISSDIENILSFSGGSKVSIPAESFVYEDGTAVKEKIEVSFRDIQSSASIIASGIHLNYDSAGAALEFKTGGMFEVRANAGSKKLKIKDGKKIKVDFASQYEGDYNFYKMDEKTGNWNYISSQESVLGKNDTQEADTEKEELLPPLMPTKLNTKTDLIIDMKIDHTKFKELKNFKGVIWKFAGGDKNKALEILSNTWSKTEVLKDGKDYLLKLSSGNTQEQIKISPVFSEKNYQQAIALYNSSISKTKKAPIDNVKSDDTVNRSYEISEMGIYNCDIIYRYPNAIFVDAKFQIKGSAEYISTDNLVVFRISGDGNVIRKFSKENYKNFFFEPNLKNKILAVLPNGKVAVMSSSDFSEMRFPSKSSKASPEEVVFALTQIDETIASTEQLDKVIRQL